MKLHRIVFLYVLAVRLVFCSKVKHKTGVIGIKDQAAFIPCNAFISAKRTAGSVTLIRWFHSSFHKPLYTLDLRSLNSSLSTNTSFIHKGRHFPSPESEGRLYLDLALDPIVLRIDPVSPEDAGIYTCKIDFRYLRSVHSSVDLEIIVPPKEAVIHDSERKKLEGVIGPFHLGESLTLTCESLGGSPTPVAIWRSSLDDLQRITINGSVLIIHSFRREDQWSHYTCTVQNTNMTASNTTFGSASP